MIGRQPGRAACGAISSPHPGADPPRCRRMQGCLRKGMQTPPRKEGAVSPADRPEGTFRAVHSRGFANVCALYNFILGYRGPFCQYSKCQRVGAFFGFMTKVQKSRMMLTLNEKLYMLLYRKNVIERFCHSAGKTAGNVCSRRFFHRLRQWKRGRWVR